ncbi:hypothetical protein [Maridesulfovibrio sp.]|uniref:hypothetical protein n=1 Tax=Maridesulfovibrio sp. TaxID=2795000 RepID=UPI002A18BC95|nr:hypothetical protein [Maridesulfovibrio sp.]
MRISINLQQSGKSANHNRLPGLSVHVLAILLLLSAFCVSNAMAGWDVSNQRETDGHKTVAGRVFTGTDLANSAENTEEPSPQAETSTPPPVNTSENESAPANDDSDFAPGEWALAFGLDDQLFPSAIIALSTLDPENIGVQRQENTFGSPLAMASVFIRAQNPGDRVTVEITSTDLIRPSKMTVTLPDAEKVYEISPHLRYEYEKLLSIRQPYPEDVTAKVFVNGEEVGEHTQTVIVRSVNDCFFGLYTDGQQNFQDWSEMFAAYVNEGDPIIDEILSEALHKGYVDAFIGYQGDEMDVTLQIEAIWKVLKDSGFRYSSITTTSVESDVVAAQHVRLVGDSTRGAQANCADGSVLLASIFRKIGLDAYLILLPDHMMVGVSNSAEQDAPVIPIETTMLASADLGQAQESAIETINEYKNDPSAVTYISINGARRAGILPLRNLYK